MAASVVDAKDGQARSVKLQSVLDIVQAPPSPNFCTIEILFGAVHLIALGTAAYACFYAAAGLEEGDRPTGAVWFPMVLFKMGFPMVPVILGCWMTRAFERCRVHMMTAGYYFNNLKMGLLPSLGYGLIVNFIFKNGIKLLVSEEVLNPLCLDLLGPASWVFGVLCWWVVSFCVDTGEEARRPDYGFYPRWRVERPRRGGEAPRVEDIVHKGPHMFFRVIPTPTHGTLKHILYASLARMIGITLLASVLWFSGVLWCLLSEGMQDYWTELDDGGSAWKVILCTEMLDLIVNTFTAPLLIFWGWRSEPLAPAGALLARSDAGALPLDDEATEHAELLRELWDDLA